MTKARDLANLISTGNPLADGALAASEVSGLHAVATSGAVADVTGAAPLASPTFTGNVSLGDNVKLKLGDGEDLEVYHDSTHSIIKDAGTGDLWIAGDNALNVTTADFTEYKARFVKDESVYLFHNNAEKFKTTATGADVTGLLNTDNLTINGAQGTNGQVLSSTGSGVGWADAGGGAYELITKTTISSQITDFSFNNITAPQGQLVMFFNDVTLTGAGDIELVYKDSSGNVLDSSGTDTYYRAGSFQDSGNNNQNSVATRQYIHFMENRQMAPSNNLRGGGKFNGRLDIFGWGTANPKLFLHNIYNNIYNNFTLQNAAVNFSGSATPASIKIQKSSTSGFTGGDIYLYKLA